jgi:hypothetical protein
MFAPDAMHVGAPAANRVGLSNAFAAERNLVSPATGAALSTTPAGNGMAPAAAINTLANILGGCAISTGGAAQDGSRCGALFAAAGGAATSDTLQAALYIAHHAGDRLAVGLLSDLIEAGGPYRPELKAGPEDWTLDLNFTGQDLKAPQSIAADSSGNIWITGGAGTTELESTGAEIPGSPFTDAESMARSCPATPAAVQTVDPSGNRWVLGDQDKVTEVMGAEFFLSAAGAELSDGSSSAAHP